MKLHLTVNKNHTVFPSAVFPLGEIEDVSGFMSKFVPEIVFDNGHSTGNISSNERSQRDIFKYILFFLNQYRSVRNYGFGFFQAIFLEVSTR